jgi:hypothetical protein
VLVAFGAAVDDPVGRLEDTEVVLDHQHVGVDEVVPAAQAGTED